MQPQPAFDTHAFIKRLTQAGMPEDQAACSRRRSTTCIHAGVGGLFPIPLYHLYPSPPHNPPTKPINF